MNDGTRTFGGALASCGVGALAGGAYTWWTGPGVLAGIPGGCVSVTTAYLLTRCAPIPEPFVQEEYEPEDGRNSDAPGDAVGVQESQWRRFIVNLRAETGSVSALTRLSIEQISWQDGGARFENTESVLDPTCMRDSEEDAIGSLNQNGWARGVYEGETGSLSITLWQQETMWGDPAFSLSFVTGPSCQPNEEYDNEIYLEAPGACTLTATVNDSESSGSLTCQDAEGQPIIGWTAFDAMGESVSVTEVSGTIQGQRLIEE